MLLAIDASRAAGREKTGVEWYAYHLLNNLQHEIPHDVRVVLYTDRPLTGTLRTLPAHWEERILPRRGPLWSQIVLASAVLRDQPDVFFVPAHVIPLALTLAPRSRRPRMVTTLHDVVFRTFPKSYSIRERVYANHATALAVRHADGIIVPTEHVACALERSFCADRVRMRVIHHGVTPSQERGSSDVHADAGTPRAPFVLYVGRLEYKKNVVRMVRAFEQIADAHPDVRLVLAGSDGYGAKAVHEAIARSPARDRIVTPGWVTSDAHRALLATATVFLFPTLAEGFGMPILDAMAAGLPVITSRGGAHEEVAGGAACCVDAQDSDAIARAMDMLLADQAQRAALHERGIARAQAFTWEKTATQTWELLRGVARAA